MSAMSGGCPPAMAVASTVGRLLPDGLVVDLHVRVHLVEGGDHFAERAASAPVQIPSKVIDPETAAVAASSRFSSALAIASRRAPRARHAEHDAARWPCACSRGCSFRGASRRRCRAGHRSKKCSARVSTTRPTSSPSLTLERGAEPADDNGFVLLHARSAGLRRCRRPRASSRVSSVSAWAALIAKCAMISEPSASRSSSRPAQHPVGRGSG